MRTIALLLTFIPLLNAAGSKLLLREPALGKTQIVFSYAGDLWTVPREGGQAVRLTSGPGVESHPVFSPDGAEVAFSGEYEGNVDIYTVSADGGLPRRLTFHPAPEIPVAWTPDGSKILFRSNAESYSRFTKLFTVSSRGGLPESLPLPSGFSGSYSADQQRLAYLPIIPAFDIWKRYRGGRTTPIWIAKLSDSTVEKIPRNNSNDINPLWIGQRIYFLSDRNGPVTLFSYDLASKKVAQAVDNHGLDMKYATAFGDTIAYEQFGAIYLFDTRSGKSHEVNIEVSGDVVDVRPSFQKVDAHIANAGISPTGKRAVFEARGDIFSVPVEHGDVRNLTDSSGVAERDPAWSPDGKLITYFSDESGEYALHLQQQNGLGAVTKIPLGDHPAFFYHPRWSPDSKKIAYTDNRLNVWFIDLDKKQPIKIDTDTYQTPFHDLSPVWSPDNKWIAYNKVLRNHQRAVFVYSVDSGKSTQVTDGMSDALYASWDKNGKYLYFAASTDTGLSSAWLDMSSIGHEVTRSVYAVVLSKSNPSPVAPESDEEGAPSKKPAKDEKASDKSPAAVQIDFDNIDQRIVSLPIPARHYTGMVAGKEGVIYLLEAADVVDQFRDQPSNTVDKFDLKTRKTDKLVDHVTGFDLSADGDKMLVKQNGKWAVSRLPRRRS